MFPPLESADIIRITWAYDIYAVVVPSLSFPLATSKKYRYVLNAIFGRSWQLMSTLILTGRNDYASRTGGVFSARRAECIRV